MPKKDFAQELKAEFKKGNLKPSQLKRSKSTEQIPHPHLTIPPLQKSKSVENIPLQPTLTDQIKQLKQELTFTQTTADNYLQRLQKLEAEHSNLESEVKEIKQQANAKIEAANERARKHKEANTQLIDQNNELRLQALKDDDQLKEYQKEIERAATKLTDLQQKEINYKVQNNQLLRTKTDLEKRLQSAETRIQKLYQLKGLPHQAPAPFTLPWKTVLLTSLVVAAIILLRP